MALQDLNRDQLEARIAELRRKKESILSGNEAFQEHAQAPRQLRPSASLAAPSVPAVLVPSPPRRTGRLPALPSLADPGATHGAAPGPALRPANLFSLPSARGSRSITKPAPRDSGLDIFGNVRRWGAGGGGEPLRDHRGRVSADLKQRVEIHPFRDGTTPQQRTAYYADSGVRHSAPVPGRPGVAAAPRTGAVGQVQELSSDQLYRLELAKQREGKRRQRQERERKEKEERDREEARLQREQEELRAKYAAEQRRESRSKANGIPTVGPAVVPAHAAPPVVQIHARSPPRHNPALPDIAPRKAPRERPLPLHGHLPPEPKRFVQPPARPGPVRSPLRLPDIQRRMPDRPPPVEPAPLLPTQTSMASHSSVQTALMSHEISRFKELLDQQRREYDLQLQNQRLEMELLREQVAGNRHPAGRGQPERRRVRGVRTPADRGELSRDLHRPPREWSLPPPPSPLEDISFAGLDLRTRGSPSPWPQPGPLPERGADIVAMLDNRPRDRPEGRELRTTLDRIIADAANLNSTTATGAQAQWPEAPWSDEAKLDTPDAAAAPPVAAPAAASPHRGRVVVVEQGGLPCVSIWIAPGMAFDKRRRDWADATSTRPPSRAPMHAESQLQACESPSRPASAVHPQGPEDPGPEPREPSPSPAAAPAAAPPAEPVASPRTAPRPDSPSATIEPTPEPSEPFEVMEASPAPPAQRAPSPPLERIPPPLERPPPPLERPPLPPAARLDESQVVVPPALPASPGLAQEPEEEPAPPRSRGASEPPQSPSPDPLEQSHFSNRSRSDAAVQEEGDDYSASFESEGANSGGLENEMTEDDLADLRRIGQEFKAISQMRKSATTSPDPVPVRPPRKTKVLKSLLQNIEETVVVPGDAPASQRKHRPWSAAHAHDKPLVGKGRPVSAGHAAQPWSRQEGDLIRAGPAPDIEDLDAKFAMLHESYDVLDTEDVTPRRGVEG